MKISVSSYSFSQYVNSGKLTWRDTVKAAHELGIEAIEFADVPGESLDEKKKNAEYLRAQADSLNMAIPALAIGANLWQDIAEARDAEIEKLIGWLEVAEILGAPVMRHDIVWSLSKNGAGRSFDLMLPTLAESVRRVTEHAAKKGIRTCTENHGFISQDSDRIERLIAAVGHDNFGALVDIGNFACADEDSVHAVSRLAPLAVHAHAKDFHKRTFEQGPAEGYFGTRGSNYLKGCTIGDGDIPVAQCVQILKNAGYDGYITVEYEGSDDCMHGIALGRDRLKEMIG